MRNLLRSRFIQLLGGTCQIFVGMWFFGLGNGFTNTGTASAYAGGVFFIGSGLATLWFTAQGASPKVTELPPPSPEVMALVACDEKITAINLYRKETGASLRDAKQIIGNNTASTPPYA